MTRFALFLPPFFWATLNLHVMAPVAADTIQPKRRTPPIGGQAPAPMIMPGTRLDKRFNTFPAQPAAVGKAAPAWLRAKATGTPLYVIDGKPATVPQLSGLHQTQVASVTVLNGQKAASLYGKNARQGMVIITTKAGLAPRP